MRKCAAAAKTAAATGGVLFYSYRGAVLAVASEIELPGAVPTPGADAAAITVRAAPVPAALQDATARGATWQIAGKRFLFQVPGVARFLLSGGNEIVFEPAPGVDGGDVSIFLIGTVFGILLHQRGEIVLHASAVRVAGKAVLFCAPSGSGKSTLAAAGRRGAPVRKKLEKFFGEPRARGFRRAAAARRRLCAARGAAAAQARHRTAERG
jgi:hypothetical protein